MRTHTSTVVQPEWFTTLSKKEQDRLVLEILHRREDPMEFIRDDGTTLVITSK